MRVNPTSAAGPVTIKHVRNTVPKGLSPVSQLMQTIGSEIESTMRGKSTSDLVILPRKQGKSLLAQQLSDLTLPVI